MKVDALLVPTEVVARQVYAQISTPLLWRFLREVPARGDDGQFGDLVDRLHTCCGAGLARAVEDHLGPCACARTRRPVGRKAGSPWLGCWCDPEDRLLQLSVVPLLLARQDQNVVCPDGEFVLAAGDELLFAGNGHTRHELLLTMVADRLPPTFCSTGMCRQVFCGGSCRNGSAPERKTRST